jgi:hypothetical protein
MTKFLIVIGSALFLAPVAFAAGGSTTSGYGGAAGAVQTAVQKPGTTLPFTGLSLTGVLAFGILLLAAGFFIRRKARASS